jgi:hypothetical protein
MRRSVSLMTGLLLVILSSISRADVELLAESDLSETTTIASYMVDGKPVLELNGMLLSSMRTEQDLGYVQYVLSRLPKNTDFTVLLNSSGGDVGLFKALSMLIRSQCDSTESHCQVTAYVDEKCASACILLFGTAGDVRIANPQAKFGFHAARGQMGQLAPEDTSLKSYADAGVKVDWLQGLKQKGVFLKTDFSNFSGTELAPSGLVDQFKTLDLVKKVADFKNSK